jgi:hypothetical protein
MAQTVCILLSAGDRERLSAVAGDRNSLQTHVHRARIVLLSADQLPVIDVARLSGMSRPAVWRWQRRFAEEGVDGLLRDKTRKPGKPPLSPATVAKILALPCGKPPKNATHWTGRMVAKAVGVSLRAVQRLWEANRLQPHRIRTFKKSNDPAFAAKVEDIVGLYMNPPAHAVVVSIDEKSQIQALDRTQPGLPLKPGKCGTLTHDYKRHGTTTLFAALNILDGTVVGRCMPKHTHQEFINSSTPSSVPSSLANWSTLSPTTTPPTNIPRSSSGSPSIRAGSFISPLPRHPGSTPSRASSQSSPEGASGAACSPPSLTSKMRSGPISNNTTVTPNPSFGPSRQTSSSPNSADCLHPPNESEH